MDEKIANLIEKTDVVNKIVLIKVKGTLDSGKRSDINFSKYEEILSKKGSAVTFINRSGLSSVEVSRIRVHWRNQGGDRIKNNKRKNRILQSRFDY